MQHSSSWSRTHISIIHLPNVHNVIPFGTHSCGHRATLCVPKQHLQCRLRPCTRRRPQSGGQHSPARSSARPTIAPSTRSQPSWSCLTWCCLQQTDEHLVGKAGETCPKRHKTDEKQKQQRDAVVGRSAACFTAPELITFNRWSPPCLCSYIQILVL